MRIETKIKERVDIEQIERIQKLLETGSSDLVRNAVSLFAWAVEESLAGRRVGSMDATGTRVREVVNPLLDRARRTATYNLEPEGLAFVQRLISRPPEPTEALRALMRADAAGAEAS